jgi:hypothetical protein
MGRAMRLDIGGMWRKRFLTVSPRQAARPEKNVLAKSQTAKGRSPRQQAPDRVADINFNVCATPRDGTENKWRLIS